MIVETVNLIQVNLSVETVATCALLYLIWRLRASLRKK